MSSILSFDLGSTLAAPEDPMTVQLTYGQLPPSEMAAIYSELWPPINRRLAAGAPIALRGAIDVAADWLRTGAGFSGPFGYQPSEAAAAMANELGHGFLTDLEALVTGHPGLTAYLRQTADRFDHVAQLDVKDANAAFFTEVDIGADWQAEIANLRESIREAVSSWALDNPSAVMERLTTVQQELEVAGSSWPDRVQMAFGVVAELVADVVPWIEAALDADMFPAANPLLEAAVANGTELELHLWERCLSKAGSRWTAVGAALKGRVSNEILKLVLRGMQPSDYRLFEWMFTRASYRMTESDFCSQRHHLPQRQQRRQQCSREDAETTSGRPGTSKPSGSKPSSNWTSRQRRASTTTGRLSLLSIWRVPIPSVLSV